MWEVLLVFIEAKLVVQECFIYVWDHVRRLYKRKGEAGPSNEGLQTCQSLFINAIALKFDAWVKFAKPVLHLEGLNQHSLS